MENVFAKIGKFIIPALLGLAVVGGAVTYFLYEMTQSSFMAGGSKYRPIVPAPAAVDAAKVSTACQGDYTSRWIGCSLQPAAQ